MKLWILRARAPLAPGKAVGFYVLADSELSARRFASEQPGSEGEFVWLDEAHSTCVMFADSGTGIAGVLSVEFSTE